jgi:hypothetical protein
MMLHDFSVSLSKGINVVPDFMTGLVIIMGESSLNT